MSDNLNNSYFAEHGAFKDGEVLYADDLNALRTNMQMGEGEGAIKQVASGGNDMGNSAIGDDMGNSAIGRNAVALGAGNKANNIESFAHGFLTIANGNYSESSGFATVAHADISHTEGQGNVVGDLTQVEVRDIGEGGHAEGYGNLVLGKYAHAGGANNIAKGDFSKSDGIGGSDWAHPENSEVAFSKFDTINYIRNTQAGHGMSYDSANNLTYFSSGRFISGPQSFSEFIARINIGDTVRVVRSTGDNEISIVHSKSEAGFYLHGKFEWASDTYIDVQIQQTEEDVISGTSAGVGSSVSGFHNYALQDYQTVIGQYNKNKENTLFEVGNGTDNSNRSNAFEVYEDGLVAVGNKVQQKQDQESGVAPGKFSFTNSDGTSKNPNATDINSQLEPDFKFDPEEDGLILYGATGAFASAFGGKCAAMGKRSHAEGTTTIARGDYSHSEGNATVTIGKNAHAEGAITTALGSTSHAEGQKTQAKGENSHAEGMSTIAEGVGSHSEGYETKATGNHSHAEGLGSQALHEESHASGYYTKTGMSMQTVCGAYNIGRNDTFFEIGNGNETKRENAFEVRTDNTIVIKYQGKTYSLQNILAALGGFKDGIELTD